VSARLSISRSLDLHPLRGIGAYRTGVHKPTFSEPNGRRVVSAFIANAGMAPRQSSITSVGDDLCMRER
jgi:hypothetical protein